MPYLLYIAFCCVESDVVKSNAVVLFWWGVESNSFLLVSCWYLWWLLVHELSEYWSCWLFMQWKLGEILFSLPCSWGFLCCGGLCVLIGLKKREWIFTYKVRCNSFCLRFYMRFGVFFWVWKGLIWCCTHTFCSQLFTLFLCTRGRWCGARGVRFPPPPIL